MINFSNHQRGALILPLALAVMVLLVLVALPLLTLSFNQTNDSADSANSDRALNYARAGAEDAILQITRDYNYTAANIVANGNTRVITSVGQSGQSTRTVTATVVLDSDGKIVSIAWQ